MGGNSSPSIMSREQMAEYFGVSVRTVDRYSADWPYVSIGRRRWFVLDKVLDHLASNLSDNSYESIERPTHLFCPKVRIGDRSSFLFDFSESVSVNIPHFRYAVMFIGFTDNERNLWLDVLLSVPASTVREHRLEKFIS